MKYNFYIYLHINLTNNEIFYVGKGNCNRAWDEIRRSKFWKNYTNKYEYDILLIEENLTEEQAFEGEVFYISKIGRRDLGLGTLLNMTNGGEGNSQYQNKEEKIINQKLIANKAAKKWRNNNPEKVKQSNNSIKIKETKKKWKEANPDYNKIYQKNNPEKKKIAQKKYKDRIKQERLTMIF